MSENIQIRVDKPCSENWDSMLPDQQGRHCLSCQKTVVDFSMMTDRQVLDWFGRPSAKQSVCGRFHPGQLGHELVVRPQERHRRLPWLWHYLVAGLLFSSEVSAQEKPASPPISQHDRRFDDDIIVGKIAIAPAHQPSKHELPDTLRGRLISVDNGGVVGYASIKTDRNHGYAADSNGCFAIPRKALTGNRFTISAVGYKTVEIDVKKTWIDGQEKIIVLKLEEVVLGEVAVFARKTPVQKIEAIIKDTLEAVGLAKKVLTVYPNPVARGGSVTLSLRLDEPGPYAAQLFSNSGALLQTIKVEGNEQSQNIPMSIPSSLVAGTYFIRFSRPAGKPACAQEIVVF